MWGKIIAIGVLLFGTASSFYKAGKFANGGIEVVKGKGAAAAYIIGALLNATIAVLLYIDF